MAVSKWQPKQPQLDPFQSFRDVVDRLFDNACWRAPRPWAPNWVPQGSDFVPQVDVRETDTEYLVVAEVPGLTQKDLTVHISRDSVTLRGERRQEKTGDQENYHYRESAYGSFERVIPLPGPVVPENSTAKLKDGVLTLTLPKAETTPEPGLRIEVE